MPGRGYYLLYLIGVMLSFTALPVMALNQTAINDIITDPLRYQNSVVKIVGEVVKVEPDPITPGTGFFTVLDASDSPILVRTKDRLPKTGDQMFVVGMVYRDDQQSKPYLDELKKGRAAPPLTVLVGIAGILALIAFILIYLIIWHRPSPSPKVNGLTDAPVRKPMVTQVFQDDPVVVLTAIAGPHKGQTFNIYRGVTTIGREDDQTIQLSEDPTVSRQHARIVAEDGVVTLVGVSSTNPVKVDGKPVDKCDLTDGALIQFGATKLRVSVLEE